MKTAVVCLFLALVVAVMYHTVVAAPQVTECDPNCEVARCGSALHQACKCGDYMDKCGCCLYCKPCPGEREAESLFLEELISPK
uniref:Venom peptide U8-SYTX-Sth1a n=1 Tax=Scytodes thoracica TaxID=1112478 RepID=A0A0A0VBS0_SCYTH|nr:venom peptide U8-SYTX-Sth1a [Scytodes thoracica]